MISHEDKNGLKKQENATNWKTQWPSSGSIDDDGHS